MNKEELIKQAQNEIKSLVSNGCCVKVEVLLGQYNEPHHFDSYWDCYINTIYNYNGKLLYSSTGCKMSNINTISSLDVLLALIEQIKTTNIIPISEDAEEDILRDYMSWNREQWEADKHKFEYHFDLLGMETTPIEKEMTFEDAKRYVKELFKASNHKQVYIHEINGYNPCHYCVTIE